MVRLPFRLIAVALAILSVGRGPFVFAEAADSPTRVTITVDVSEVPDLKAWGEKAKVLCETWYPIIAELLKTDGYVPPKAVTLLFKKDMDGIAGTGGSEIAISARWVRDHPDDFGMVIHELTHVVQGYPKYRPVWLVEGIADYIRYWRFEPSSRAREFNPKTSSYRRGYQSAAALLAWLEESQHKGIIRDLNKAMRAGTCTERTIEALTGKRADRWWAEYLEARRGGPRPNGSAPSGSPLADIGPAPSVALIDEAGRPFSLENLRGKAVIVSFIYTTCNGVCPATTHNLYRVQQALKEAKLWGERVAIVSISLDPIRDTPEVLANYARIYGADRDAWHFLTGSAADVAKVVAAWGMWAKVGPSGTLDHPSRIFLVDAGGHLREIYHLDFLTTDSVLQDVRTLLAEGARP